MLGSLPFTMTGEQSGAVGACWAHNPEVGRSKLLSAKTFFVIHNSPIMKSDHMCSKYVLVIKCVIFLPVDRIKSQNSDVNILHRISQSQLRQRLFVPKTYLRGVH